MRNVFIATLAGIGALFLSIWLLKLSLGIGGLIALIVGAFVIFGDK